MPFSPPYANVWFSAPGVRCNVETQEEVDYFRDRLTADGGTGSRCGWLKDKLGLSWQVVPSALGRYLGDPDRQKADRVMHAMMGCGRS